MANPVSSSPQLLPVFAATNGAANQRAESRKRAIYSGVSAAMGLRFVPLAIEVFGRFGRGCEELLRDLAGKAVANFAEVDQVVANKLHVTLIHLWKTKISCILQKGNARIIHMAAFRCSQQIAAPIDHPDFGILQERLHFDWLYSVLFCPVIRFLLFL